MKHKCRFGSCSKQALAKINIMGACQLPCSIIGGAFAACMMVFFDVTYIVQDPIIVRSPLYLQLWYRLPGLD